MNTAIQAGINKIELFKIDSLFVSIITQLGKGFLRRYGEWKIKCKYFTTWCVIILQNNSFYENTYSLFIK